MTGHDDRRDDWAHGVDENLASINAASRVLDREISRLWKAHAEDDKLLRGDKEKETDGLIARLHAQETQINLLHATLINHTARLGTLEGANQASENRIKLWVAIVGFLSAVVVGGLYNIDRIQALLNRKHKPDRLEQMLENAKRPKARHRHVVAPEEPEPTEDAPAN